MDAALAGDPASRVAVETLLTTGLVVLAGEITTTAALRPAAPVHALDRRRPIYRRTAAYGHFGRDEPGFTWEHTGKAAALRSAAGLT